MSRPSVRMREQTFFFLREGALCSFVCADVIVKVTLKWPADEQTLNLMGKELQFSDSLIPFVKHALNLTRSQHRGAVQFTPLMVTSCINIGPDAYLSLSFLKCCPHLFFCFFFPPGGLIQIIDESGLQPQSSLPHNLNFWICSVWDAASQEGSAVITK